jgi:DNA-binding transcriptional ArsR family regulator
MDLEDDTYSIIFNALKHPIRRKILRMLNQSPSPYTEILTTLSIENGLLNYHLDNMKELLTKDEEGRYKLSEFGRAAINLIEKVEEPIKKEPTSLLSLTTTKVKAIFLIMIIAIGSMGAYIAYNQFQSKEKPITAIVVRLDEAKYSDQNLLGFNGLLRLITDSTLSGADTGEIKDYFIKTNASDIQQGWLVTGFISQGDPISVFTVNHAQPFFTWFVNASDFVRVSYIGIWTGNQNPELGIELSNLSDKPITSIRCNINGTVLPFTWGVSKTNSIQPSYDFSSSVYTNWVDPTTGERGGLTPSTGKTYLVHIELGYQDGAIRSIDNLVVAQGGASISSIVMINPISVPKVDLLETNAGSPLISMSFRCTWYSKAITRIEIHIDDKLMVDAPCNLVLGWYWVGSMKVPFNIYNGGEYNVTLSVYSDDGAFYTTSQMVTCQHL